MADVAVPLLEARRLSVGYHPGNPILDGVDLTIPPGRITALIGANGSGKSTLLRTLGNALPPLRGQVLLDGTDLRAIPRRRIARTVSMLPQQPVAPEGITVRGLSEFGRHPHRGFLTRERPEDRAIVEQSLAAAGLDDLADRTLDSLSGGQRQRAWISMALAQDTPVMLLDEPTTYLDIAHQLEVLDLLADLNRRRGTAIVMVVHDLNQAAHYAHHVVAVHSGRVHATGTPHEVLTEQLVKEVFGVGSVVIDHPVTHAPLVLPLPRTPYAVATLGSQTDTLAGRRWRQR
ncbi:ABC transporter ATP-binding protein [Micromonospora sp. WMMD1082]|uniref:ABC transporter ATP-binding protein n=1 Tax=Micromonospora sp. WMMD1082 TaxID=3016104 RepID=UPI0024169DB6|nr:ABC transporter ATP-binding protein [Micromonospora sp. WMMD1082]MDG4797076.1 ABC transporter ATP-binding protein [Micromonospora sp. WMMD1082]